MILTLALDTALLTQLPQQLRIGHAQKQRASFPGSIGLNVQDLAHIHPGLHNEDLDGCYLSTKISPV